MKKSSEDEPEVDMGIESIPQEKEQEHMKSKPPSLKEKQCVLPYEGFGLCVPNKEICLH